MISLPWWVIVRIIPQINAIVCEFEVRVCNTVISNLMDKSTLEDLAQKKRSFYNYAFMSLPGHIYVHASIYSILKPCTGFAFATLLTCVDTVARRTNINSTIAIITPETVIGIWYL